MDIRNRRALRGTASDALAANPGNPRLTVLVFIAAAALSALLVTILLNVLDSRIAGTGGLSALGLRAVLSTVRTILPFAQSLALMGLQLGLQLAALWVIRGRAVGPRTLLGGFSRFGALMRSMLLQGLLYFLLGTASMYAATFLFMLTPMSADFMELVAPMLSDSQALYDAMYNDAAFLARMGTALLPLFPIMLVIFLAVAAPFFYQYRFTNYCLVEEPRMGALAAMGESARMLRGNRLKLLQLDLSFWWFYLGQVLVAAVLYGDVLLSMLGVALPWSAEVSYYAFYIASLAMEGVLYWFCLNQVECTYAAAYEALRPRPQPTQGAVLGNIFDLAREYYEENRD